MLTRQEILRRRGHCAPDASPSHVVLRRRNLDPVDLVVLRGLPVTALPLTVLDAAAAL